MLPRRDEKNSYTRDTLGRITQKVETIQGVTTTFDYFYDLAGRLERVDENGVPARTYAYDSNGNRLSVTEGATVTSGTYDSQDRLLTYGTNTYTYNLAGDLTSKTDSSQPSGQQTTSYSYDALGNLIQVVLPDATTIDYVIDGQNRRVGKKVNGTLVQAFVYQDQLNPVAEFDGTGSLVARFLYGSRPNVPDFIVKSGATYRVLTDHLGSPKLLVDTATGAIAQRLDFNEFGSVGQDTNSGFQPFGFAGGLRDQDTGLVRFGARDYDAIAGRWTGTDPLRFEAGDANLFRYSLGDPINNTDPTGTVSSTFRLYVGIGFSFTYGIGPQGQFFQVSAGFGLGGGLTVNPSGQFVAQPEDFECPPPPGTPIGFVGAGYGAGVRFGPFSLGSSYTNGLGIANQPGSIAPGAPQRGANIVKSGPTSTLKPNASGVSASARVNLVKLGLSSGN